MLPVASVSCEGNSTTRVPSLRVSLTVTPGSGLSSWLILTVKVELNSVSLGLHPYIEQAAEEVGRDANTSAKMARKCDFMAESRSQKSILRDRLKFQMGLGAKTVMPGLAFEGAGGAWGEFDGVFGAGFFGVLFEG